ncbi:MAG TPA: hypothetical protein VM533_00410 [Fimbriiglobus sp.]|jgi:hypothetical protein|nr:hypothetical protein [Fimbriiglobus sp.]
MANIHPQNQPPHEENPLTAMLVSLSGSGGPAHETGPPGANELSVRAGHEPDRFQVRSILYVPAAVVAVLVVAYLLVTWLFAMTMSGQDAAVARAKRENPQATAMNTADWNARIGQVSSTRPEPPPGEQATGTAQPRREGLYQTLNKTDGTEDPPHYRSKLADPAGNNPRDLRPEDLRPENYVGFFLDPVRGEKVLAQYGWADEGKKIARVPINDAIKMVAEGKLKLPVRKDAVVPPATSVERARLSNAGRGVQPAATPAPKEHKDHKDEKK